MFTPEAIIAGIALKSAILLFVSTFFLCLFLCWWNSPSTILTVVQNSPCVFVGFGLEDEGAGLDCILLWGWSWGNTRHRSLSFVGLGNIWHLAALMFLWSWHPKPIHVLLPIAFPWVQICIIYILPSSYLQSLCLCVLHASLGFPGGSDGKEFTYNARDPGLNPGSRRSPGEENVNPLQYSCLENPMDREACRLKSMGSQKVGHNLARRSTSWNQDCQEKYQ